MMSTRHALSTFGILMVVVALLAPADALAQGPDVAELTAGSLMVTPTPSPASHDRLLVTIDFMRENVAESTDQFRVYYRTGEAVSDDNRESAGFMDLPVPSGTGTRHTMTLTGLKGGTSYFVGIARKRTTTVGGAFALENGQYTTAAVMTGSLPLPDRVLNVVIDSSADTMLEVSWDAPYAGAAGLTIKEYEVKYNTSMTASKAAGRAVVVKVTGMMATISNLMMGTMYDVQVRAVNSAEGKGEYSVKMTATPGMAGGGTTTTPALPLFGILALFAGLLAAGRARLRR